MDKTKNILQIDNLNFSYRKNSEFMLRNISLNFAPHKIYAFLGQNGSGKSTLLNCICNLVANYDGKIIFNDNKNSYKIKKLNNQNRAKLISLVPQTTLANTLTVYDSIMLGRKPYINISPMPVDHEMVSKTIDIFNLNYLSLKATNQLSGGELQTVSIARAFAQNAKLMLLDEPTNNLDVKKQNDTFKILKKYVSQNKLTIICVLHDINQAIKYADELIFMKNGKIIKQGDKSIVDKNLLKEIYDVDAKILPEGFVLI